MLCQCRHPLLPNTFADDISLTLCLCNIHLSTVRAKRFRGFFVFRLFTDYRLSLFYYWVTKRKNPRKHMKRRQFDQFIEDSSELVHTFGLTEKTFLYTYLLTNSRQKRRFALSPESLKFEKLDLFSWSKTSVLSCHKHLIDPDARLGRRVYDRENKWISSILRWRCNLRTTGWCNYFHVTVSLFELISKKCRLVGTIN